MPAGLSDYNHDWDAVILFITQLNLVIVLLWMNI